MTYLLWLAAMTEATQFDINSRTSDTWNAVAEKLTDEELDVVYKSYRED